MSLWKDILSGINEKVLQYIAALRDLATTCTFAKTLDEMLRDQLVETLLTLAFGKDY